MENKYLVYYTDDDPYESIRLVYAKNEGEAIEKYARQIMIVEEVFLEDVYRNYTTYSIGEQFYGDENGYFFDDHLNMREGITEEYAKKCFNKNVRDFFESKTEYADLYLDFFWNNTCEDPYEAMKKWKFPEEMLIILATKGAWSNLISHTVTELK